MTVVCPKCDNMYSSRYRDCPDCGHKFTIRDSDEWNDHHDDCDEEEETDG